MVNARGGRGLEDFYDLVEKVSSQCS
jgi:hypothetical protein